jgi:amino acid adenylation domain-containing protein
MKEAAEGLLESTGALFNPGSAPIFEFPCSHAQRRFWILDRLQPGAPWLNIAVRWHMAGRVEPEKLRAAFGALLQRHEILRTGFIEVDGAPRQRIVSEVPVELPTIDLATLPREAREAEATRITLDLAAKPFDLDTPPLIRIALLHLGGTEWRLLCTLHHIIGDGWSIGLVMRDLADLYERALQPTLPPLPPPELHYADIALWAAEHPADAAARAYWERRLKNLKPFELLTDRPRQATRLGRAAIATRLLPVALTEAGIDWAHAHGTTFFTLSLATLATVLHRFGTERDIVIGTQVAGRSRPEMEPVIGPFINTLVLLVDAAGDPDFLTLFERAREAVEGALTHAETPFEEMVNIVRPTRSTGHHHPLFQINLIHQRSFVPDQHRAEFRLLDMPSLSPGAPYDLNFFMVERGEGWRLSCEYDTDLFEAETVARLLHLFETVLASAIAAPEKRIGELASAGHEDRASIARWNETRAAIPDASLPVLITAEAERAPGAVAVLGGGERLTYAELESRSNRLAHLLIGRGVVPGDRIGICLDRSVLLPVALLAILKTGAAYVPLDPDYPEARLAMMAEDAGLKALVTRRSLAATVPGRGEASILLDTVQDMLAALPDRCPNIRRAPQDIAYLLFTSGSTGRPKGVEIPDRALVNLLTAMRRKPGLGPDDVLVSVTSISFDIAALELFLPLVAGARLVIASQAETRDGDALADLLKRSDATVIQATPATYHLLLDTGWTGPGRLKMLCGGEALPRSLAARLLPHGELWNMYGPTETTIWSAALAVTDGTGPVPVGGPIANTRFEVLDEALRRVPLGAPGELMIGGAGLARGYLGNPSLTAERFVHPDDPDLGDRLYRTGDLVRWRRDGTLEFLGRLDQQVKLRGHRIELGEVEAALADDPAVAAVAIALQTGPGDAPRLVAFVVPEDPTLSSTVLESQVRHRAATVLPAYMRPSAVVALAALPFTPNGKIDRRRLPQAVLPDPGQTAEPLDPVERRLAAIWQDLLGPIEIGRDADFFELGGDSLSASRLSARLKREFGVSVSLSVLFEDATLGRLAQLVRPQPEAHPARVMAEEDDPALVVIRRDGSRKPLWGIATPTIFRKLAERLAIDRPFNVIRPPDSEAGIFLSCQTLEQIAAYYLARLRRLQPTGPYALLGFCCDAAVSFEMTRQLESKGETVDLLVLIDAWAPGYRWRLGPIRGRLAYTEYKAKRLIDILGRLATGTVRAIRTGDPHAVTAGLPKSDPIYGASAAARMHDHTAACTSRARPGTVKAGALVIRSAFQPDGFFLDRHLGWPALVRGGTSLVTVSGDHLGIFFEPGVDALADGINTFVRTGPRPTATP